MNTDAAFEELSWHDCHIWGLAVRVGEMSDGDFTSELVLDLDFIVEWLCSPGSLARFRVVPAELVFHDVSELHVSADWREQVSRPDVIVPVSPAQIDHVHRAARPHAAGWDWTIHLNSPRGGELRFVASGFVQTLRAQPVECDHQRLPHRLRQRLLAAPGDTWTAGVS